MRKNLKRRKLDIDNKFTKKLARSVRRGVEKRSEVKEESSVEFLHSGSHTFNLALSGKARNGGWARGRVCNLVGDGSSGKSLCALELAFWCFKELSNINSKIFGKTKKVTVVYNNPEGVMDFPLVKMYGQDFVDFVEWDCIKNVEECGRDYIRRTESLNKGEFLLYIIDSWDALGSHARTERMKKSVKDNNELEGSYGLEKQAYAGIFFEYISGMLSNNSCDSTLFIISQVRQKIGVTFGKKTYRTGGKALDFYTHQVAWIAEIEKLKKTKRGFTRIYGIKSRCKVERSKVAKPFRDSDFQILFDYGLDDISSMIDFIWGKGAITFDDKKYPPVRRLNFIKYIEEDKEREERLIDMVERKWCEIEEEFSKDVSNRKKRY